MVQNPYYHVETRESGGMWLWGTYEIKDKQTYTGKNGKKYTIHFDISAVDSIPGRNWVKRRRAIAWSDYVNAIQEAERNAEDAKTIKEKEQETKNDGSGKDPKGTTLTIKGKDGKNRNVEGNWTKNSDGGVSFQPLYDESEKPINLATVGQMNLIMDKIKEIHLNTSKPVAEKARDIAEIKAEIQAINDKITEPFKEAEEKEQQKKNQLAAEARKAREEGNRTQEAIAIASMKEVDKKINEIRGQRAMIPDGKFVDDYIKNLNEMNNPNTTITEGLKSPMFWVKGVGIVIVLVIGFFVLRWLYRKIAGE